MAVTTQSKSGVCQWMFQRISNAVIVLYGLVILLIALLSDNMLDVFSNGLFLFYSLITLAFACANSILAGWQIAGDYLKSAAVNKIVVAAVALVSVIYFIWGLTVVF